MTMLRILTVVCLMASLAWLIAGTAVIFSVYFFRGVKFGDATHRRKYTHVIVIAGSYLLLAGRDICGVCWTLMHPGQHVPMWLRLGFTLPAIIAGDVALWQMFGYQFKALFAGLRTE